MKVFLRNPDGTRGAFLVDLDDEATIKHWERQVPLRRIRALAMDRVRAVRLRIACGTFGRGGGAHRERRHRRDRTRLLYRLISG
ncbi:hypothetical protein [Actinophytocola sp.]|uniref:hypothetical protein n=1 Tax=Actinophytocola sp. TaxID=1872138 RepID=UPI002D802E16|nr:hypothetical protein [Actinophytocola sp.]HET9144122.1 hypothetical protein [Actinophytocola sp.]